jgi:nicotinamide-nucleotide amidase
LARLGVCVQTVLTVHCVLAVAGALDVLTMRELLPLSERAGALLAARGETVAVGESAAGGLITAALLGVPGASGWVRGGLVIYTRHALFALKDVDREPLRGMRAATEPYARFEAATLRQHFGTTWGVGESGAAGPGGNKYGDAAGHCCVAVSGPVEASRTIATGSSDRVDNMHAFARAALELLIETLERR